MDKPDGLEPLFLTGPTLEIFKIRTEEVSVLHIPKADILDDISKRRAISDFQPFKDKIQAVEGDDIVLVYDAEWKYGQNFYLCLSKEAIELVMPPTKEEARVEEDTKLKERQPWVSLGSEKEVDLERDIQSRDLIKLKLSRKRKEFGAPVSFQTSHSSINIAGEATAASVRKLELNKGVQSAAVHAETPTQTPWPGLVNGSTQYEPILLDEKQTSALLQTKTLSDFAADAERKVKSMLATNEIVDLFDDPYVKLRKNEINFEQEQHVGLRELSSFTDIKLSKNKSVSAIDWHPFDSNLVAVASSGRRTYDEILEESGMQFDATQNVILVWRINAIKPSLVLTSPDELFCFKFSPSGKHVVAGTKHGFLVVWDLTQHLQKLMQIAEQQVEQTPSQLLKKEEILTLAHSGIVSVENAHKGVVNDIKWLPVDFEIASNGAYEQKKQVSSARFLLSAGIDGQVMFWEFHDMLEVELWKPVFKFMVKSSDGSFDYGVTKIVLPRMDEQSKKAASSKTFVATEEGDVLCFDWKNEKTDSRGVDACFKAHASFITELQRNPFAEDLVLSVGGKSFCVWKEGVNSPIFSHELLLQTYTVATWSQTRPSVIFLGKSDGTVEIWDLLEKTNERVAVQNVSVSPISSLAFGLSNAPLCQIAFGDDLGTTFVFQVPKTLVRPQKNELETLRSYVEMAVKRVKKYKEPSEEAKEVLRERLRLPDNFMEQIEKASQLVKL